MEWLIEHVDDPTVDAPLPGQDSSGASGAAAATTLSPSASASASVSILPKLSKQSSSDECSRQDELTEIFKRIRRKREFRPDSRCEWLLGDRKPSPEDLDKGIDTNSPLFQAILENPVVQLGLTNPKTLLGIIPCDMWVGGHVPRQVRVMAEFEKPLLSMLCVFYAAFEDMLENPLNSTQWMNDPETGPVMLQISRIFQTLNRT
ncbi:hypothetical protein GOODEAATRI_020194 [Goodea atripinnis]|uniref:Uncharacterized protein n=1 Tax=Goodea atripinnis TaxID=208336 RepID=A0ABV0NLS8_9TELE